MHIRYAADNHIVDVLVNGQSLFTRDRSIAAHNKAMAAYQRVGDRA